jgi:hypothetical protein
MAVDEADLRREIARLRDEVNRQAALSLEFIQLFRAHISNIAIFNQASMRDRVPEKLDELEKQATRAGGGAGG